jgi:hypothetical protein
MEIGKSIHPALSAAWKIRNRCSEPYLLHRNRKIHAVDAAVCVESNIHAEQVSNHAHLAILPHMINKSAWLS